MSITYIDTHSRITDALSGRTVDYALYKGKELHIVCKDSHIVVLQADVNGDIQHKKTDVSIVLPGVEMFGKAQQI